MGTYKAPVPLVVIAADSPVPRVLYPKEINKLTTDGWKGLNQLNKGKTSYFA